MREPPCRYARRYTSCTYCRLAYLKPGSFIYSPYLVLTNRCMFLDLLLKSGTGFVVGILSLSFSIKKKRIIKPETWKICSNITCMLMSVRLWNFPRLNGNNVQCSGLLPDCVTKPFGYHVDRGVSWFPCRKVSRTTTVIQVRCRRPLACLCLDLRYVKNLARIPRKNKTSINYKTEVPAFSFEN